MHEGTESRVQSYLESELHGSTYRVPERLFVVQFMLRHRS
jgi:hypothetical protein